MQVDAHSARSLTRLQISTKAPSKWRNQSRPLATTPISSSPWVKVVKASRITSSNEALQMFPKWRLATQPCEWLTWHLRKWRTTPRRTATVSAPPQLIARNHRAPTCHSKPNWTKCRGFKCRSQLMTFYASTRSSRNSSSRKIATSSRLTRKDSMD
jgi:hypothetical protein